MQNQAEFVKFLIGAKKPSIAEIELTLFENCDVNCAFCSHDKKSTVGLSREEIMGKLVQIEDFLDCIDPDIREVNLHLVGGELLQDRLIKDGILDVYTDLIKSYKSICDKRSLSTNVIIVSNFLMTETSAVHKWIESLQTVVSTFFIASYDPTGRPLNDTYYQNLSDLKGYISNINMVLTKQTIKKLLQDSSTLMNLYNEFPIFVDDFLPDQNTEYMIPSNDDFREYLALVRDKFPALSPYGDALNYLNSSSVNQIQFTTFNKCTIFPDGSMSNYLWSRHKPEMFNVEVDYSDNSNMLLAYLNKYKCFSCEFYSACPLRCPVSWSWKREEGHSEDCAIKEHFSVSFLSQAEEL